MCIERHRRGTLHHFPLSFLFCTQIKDKDEEEKVGRKEFTKRLRNLLFGDLGEKCDLCQVGKALVGIFPGLFGFHGPLEITGP